MRQSEPLGIGQGREIHSATEEYQRGDIAGNSTKEYRDQLNESLAPDRTSDRYQ